MLEADEPGAHRSRCAEFCGLQHAQMGLVVVAEPPDAFAAWVARASSRPPPRRRRPPGRGQEVFLGAGGCAECHTVGGTDGHGHHRARPHPPRQPAHAWARRPWPTRPADLAEWVADPHTIKRGVAMPAPGLPDDELDALVAYLGGLR